MNNPLLMMKLFLGEFTIITKFTLRNKLSKLVDIVFYCLIKYIRDSGMKYTCIKVDVFTDFHLQVGQS